MRGASAPRSFVWNTCCMATDMAELRTMAKPSLKIAVRSSVTTTPPRWSSAEFAILSRRPASTWSVMAMRARRSGVTFGSSSALRMRTTESGKDGRTRSPRFSSFASCSRKAKAEAWTLAGSAVADMRCSWQRHGSRVRTRLPVIGGVDRSLSPAEARRPSVNIAPFSPGGQVMNKNASGAALAVALSLAATAAADTDASLEQVLPHLIELRHDIHQHPELSNRETRTSALVAKEMKAL